MSLSNSLKSVASQTIKLLQLGSIPTTEDLRYMLTTSGKAQKPVALPFKKDQEGPTFVIRYIPPNRWIFEQGEGASAQHVWEKFSTDVLMIQNKVKIDSANVRTGGVIQADTAVKANPDPFKASAPIAPAADTSKIPNVGFDTLQRLAAARPAEPGQTAAPIPEPRFDSWTGDQGTPESMEGPPAGWEGSDEAGTAEDAGQQNNLFESWMPVEMPPSVELDPLASEDVMNLLRDPVTGFTSFSAFTFFLIRELIRLEVSSSPLAIVVFEFANLQSGKPVDYSKTEMESITSHLAGLCSTLHITSRLEGGEFAVLLCDQNAEGAGAFANALRQIFEADDLLLRLSTEPLALLIGIATAPEATNDPGTLIAAAHQSKEVARHTGDPFVVFS